MSVAGNEMRDSFCEEFAGAVAGFNSKGATDGLRRQLEVAAEAKQPGDELAVMLQQAVALGVGNDGTQAFGKQELRAAFDRQGGDVIGQFEENAVAAIDREVRRFLQ